MPVPVLNSVGTIGKKNTQTSRIFYEERGNHTNIRFLIKITGYSQVMSSKFQEKNYPSKDGPQMSSTS